MAKNKAQYICTSCGTVYSKWAGKCDACGQWDVIEEYKESFAKKKISADASRHVLELSGLQGSEKTKARLDTGNGEFNRVLGGGLVIGSAALIGGDPGVGKSTLLLQVLSHMAGYNNADENDFLYVTGEESIEQVRLRAARLGVEQSPMKLTAAASVQDIIATMDAYRPKVAVIDSVQTLFLDNIDSAPGTVSQVRGATYELVSFAKERDIALLLVGHVTKEGQIAGPKVLEHMVDTVLYFEGDRGNQFRMVRSVKNRFGAANEIGVFEMTAKGLAEVPNPSSLFTSGKAGEVSGSVIFAGMEGTRPVLLEIQALISPSTMAMPRRAVVGWDSNRLAMVLAVLQTRAGVKLGDKEVYLNVAGGLKIVEPAADLAVAAALMSALANIRLPAETAIFGEIGLSGEVRPVQHILTRLKEAQKLGFENVIMPPLPPKQELPDGLRCNYTEYVSDLRGIFSSEKI